MKIFKKCKKTEKVFVPASYLSEQNQGLGIEVLVAILCTSILILIFAVKH